MEDEGGAKLSSHLSKQIDTEFKQPSEIFRILTSETKLATLHELQTVYGLEDVYDMMELLELHDAIRIDTQPKGNK